MRWLVVALIVASASCSTGPDCAAACSKMVQCPNIHGTYLLSCSNVNGDCYDTDTSTIATCAQCILDHDCTKLADGACDGPCVHVADGG